MIIPYRGWLPDGELDPPDPVGGEWHENEVTSEEEEDYDEDIDDEGEENNHYERYGYKL